MTNKLVPANNPDSPQYKGNNNMDATNTTTANEVNGSVMVNEFVEGETNIPEPLVDNPYTIQGGGNIYNVFYKHLLLKIGAKSPIEAVEKGYMRMYENIGNFRDKSSVNLGVQMHNDIRDNKVYRYNVRKFSIKHPQYNYRIKISKN